MGKLLRFPRRKKARLEEARALFPPFRAGATDARPSGIPYDASMTEDGTRAGQAPNPEIERKRARRQRSVVAVLVFIFLGGTAAAIFGDHGYLDVQRQRRHLREMRDAHAAHLERVQALRHEVDRLKTDPFAVERIAREDLGFVAKDELTLLLPGEDSADGSGFDAKPGSAIVPAVRRTP